MNGAVQLLSTLGKVMVEKLNAASEAATGTIGQVASVVAAYVSRNALLAGEIPSPMRAAHKAIIGLKVGASAVTAASPPEPAVPPKMSITREYMICLESGRKPFDLVAAG